jgi:LytS/YehU family sensor histidine kinase
VKKWNSLKPYLEIQKTRFAERLHLSVDVEEFLSARVPSLILQPMVRKCHRTWHREAHREACCGSASSAITAF